MARQILTLEERFMQYVSPEPNSGCWLWTATLDPNGYGRMTIGSRSDGTRTLGQAHRIAYELFIGAVPPGAFICHRCDNPPCSNPDHLFLGDRAVNSTDMAKKNRGRKSFTGLPFGVTRREARDSRHFRAVVWSGKKLHHLGRYASCEEASAVASAFKLERLALELDRQNSDSLHALEGFVVNDTSDANPDFETILGTEWDRDACAGSVLPQERAET